MESGKPAPNFRLNDLHGQAHHLDDYRGRIAIVNFLSAECPHAAHVDLGLAPLLEHWDDDAQLLQIAAKSKEPLTKLHKVAGQRGEGIILHDVEQTVADAYTATNTPRIFIIDSERLLQYHGTYDDLTCRQRAATQNYGKDAVETLLYGCKPEVTSFPLFGCTIVRTD